MKDQPEKSGFGTRIVNALTDLFILAALIVMAVSAGYFTAIYLRTSQQPAELLQPGATPATVFEPPIKTEKTEAEPPPITAWIPPEIRENLPIPSFTPPPPAISHENGKPVQFFKNKIKGVSFYETVVDLSDPETFITIGLANNSAMANSAEQSHGDENFESMVKRYRASVVLNGTFFSKDEQRRVMGNVVAGGRFLKYSRWENYGTTLGLKTGNQPELVTARIEGQPKWSDHWFSLTCGPRLLKQGEVTLHAEAEGFADSHVLGIGPRVAAGLNARGDKLYFVTFLNGLSLLREAEMMKAIGCSEAMNLDGGASRALAHEGQIVVPAGRPLTNVIVIYDCRHKAPASLVASWDKFQSDEHAVAAAGRSFFP